MTAKSWREIYDEFSSSTEEPSMMIFAGMVYLRHEDGSVEEFSLDEALRAAMLPADDSPKEDKL